MCLEQFPGGVWLVELAAISDPAMVIPTVAATLAVQPQPMISFTDAIVDWLRGRLLLLA